MELMFAQRIVTTSIKTTFIITPILWFEMTFDSGLITGADSSLSKENIGALTSYRTTSCHTEPGINNVLKWILQMPYASILHLKGSKDPNTSAC